jgi:hypothetical protein
MDSGSDPVAGVDYPPTFQKMDQWFRTDEACREYIRRLRWPAGFSCPQCGVSGEPWIMSNKSLRCRSCQARTSLIAGTIFEGTRKLLRTWFMATWFITSQKNGVSALGLQRVLGLGSYETAWTWLHKLRRAMAPPGRDCLNGIVEVDETYVGGSEKSKWGREIDSKAIVAVAAEENGQGIGRIRLRRVEDVSAASFTAPSSENQQDRAKLQCQVSEGDTHLLEYNLSPWTMRKSLASLARDEASRRKVLT